MIVERMDRQSGFITLEMSDKELRTITNLLCKARKIMDFDTTEYAVNSELFAAITFLKHGRFPNFELRHVKELQDKAQKEKG